MRPLDEPYTVAMPWYEESEYSELWSRAHDREHMPPDYAVWHANAKRALSRMLATGRAVEVITIRPAAYRGWLASRRLENTAATRRRYVEEIASGFAEAAEASDAAELDGSCQGIPAIEKALPLRIGTAK